jgi:hypothetical protein
MHTYYDGNMGALEILNLYDATEIVWTMSKTNFV